MSISFVLTYMFATCSLQVRNLEDQRYSAAVASNSESGELKIEDRKI